MLIVKSDRAPRLQNFLAIVLLTQLLHQTVTNVSLVRTIIIIIFDVYQFCNHEHSDIQKEIHKSIHHKGSSYLLLRS